MMHIQRHSLRIEEQEPYIEPYPNWIVALVWLAGLLIGWPVVILAVYAAYSLFQ